MIKKLWIIYAAVVCLFSAPIYAAQEELHQSCMEAMLKDEKPQNNTPELKKFTGQMCDCLIAKMNKNNEVDNKTLSKTCFFSSLLHYATDDLEENATDSEMMTACRGMLNVHKDKTSDNELKMVADFCQCAQPQLLDLFKKSDSMTDKQYDEGIYSIAGACSANIKLNN